VVLMRTREAYLTDGGGREAVVTGMRSTAAASTGGAIVMVAALIPFATTQLINVRELGVGVGIAVLLNALLLRPVLLPAAVSLYGRLGWWPTHGPRPPKGLRTEAARRLRRLPRPRRPQPPLHGPHAAH